MALSNSFDWIMTRNQIITRSLRICGVVQQGQNPTAEQISEGAEALNALVQSYSNELNLLFGYSWMTKTFSASDEKTGTDGNIYTCIRSHTSSTADKPITGADYTTYWFVRGSTGGVWADATAYTSIGDFTITPSTAGVIGIDKAFIRYNNVDHSPLEIGSLPQYLDFPDKTTLGTPQFLAFQNAHSPKVWLYPQPNDTNMVLHYLAIKKLQDFDSASNNPDLFARHMRMLVFDLAADLGSEYGLNPNEISFLGNKAGALKSVMRFKDRDKEENNFVTGAFF